MSSGFADKVYEVVARIPSGCVMTYGQIAMMIGHPRAAKVVGGAMSRAPAERNLPCHRVVSATGKLAPGYVFGSQADQRAILRLEGVTFLPDGRIDLERHLWYGME